MIGELKNLASRKLAEARARLANNNAVLARILKLVKDVERIAEYRIALPESVPTLLKRC